MLTEMARRQSLKQLLTSCRARLVPGLLRPGHRAAAGGPAAGLRQQETARLLGISARQYGKLERGELTTPAAQLLSITAERLCMTPEERVLFYVFASGHPPPQRGEPCTTLPLTSKKSFLRLAEPHPAVVTDRAWNILDHNAPATEWFTDPRRTAPEDRNIVAWLFTEEAAARLVDIADERRNAMAQLRTACSRAPGDPALEALVDRLTDIPEAARLWHTQPARVGPVIHVRRMRHPVDGTVCAVPGITAELPGGRYLALHLTSCAAASPPRERCGEHALDVPPPDEH